MAEIFTTPSRTCTSANESLLRLQHVSKTYGSKGAITYALKQIDMTVDRGEFVAIMGPSGSGKTTLLNCISSIDRPTEGKIILNGQDITRLKLKELSKFRREQLGFVFQDSNLIETLTCYENIALALTIKGSSKSSINALVTQIAHTFCVDEVLSKFPNQVSGGQKQRVAAARAVVTHPELILADEPTGALDSKSSTTLLKTFTMMCSDLGSTILMVTHDSYAASFAQRIVFIKDGVIFNELNKGSMDRCTFFNRIMEVVSFMGSEV